MLANAGMIVDWPGAARCGKRQARRLRSVKENPP